MMICTRPNQLAYFGLSKHGGDPPVSCTKAVLPGSSLDGELKCSIGLVLSIYKKIQRVQNTGRGQTSRIFFSMFFVVANFG